MSDIRVFGSVARGDAGPGSDLDLLAHIRRNTSLLTLVRFEQQAEARLGVPVQVVADDAIYPRIRANVLKDAVPL